MKIVLPPGADPATYTDLTERLLDVPAAISAPPIAIEKDAMAVATLVLSLPSALLATWDLAERMGLLARVRAYLEALRRQPRSDEMAVALASGTTRRLADVTEGEVLDAAVAASPSGSPEDQDWDVFIIHAGPDREAARRIWTVLMARGVQAYLDGASLRPGHDWPHRLSAAMARTRVFVVLVSGNWAQGWYNEDEVARAISLCRAHPDRGLVPVVLGPNPLQPHELPYGLGHVQAVVVGAKVAGDGAVAVLDAVKSLLR